MFGKNLNDYESKRVFDKTMQFILSGNDEKIKYDKEMKEVMSKIKTEDFSTCANILVEAYKGEPWNNSWTKKEALLRIEATMSGTTIIFKAFKNSVPIN